MCYHPDAKYPAHEVASDIARMVEREPLDVGSDLTLGALTRAVADRLKYLAGWSSPTVEKNVVRFTTFTRRTFEVALEVLADVSPVGADQFDFDAGGQLVRGTVREVK